MYFLSQMYQSIAQGKYYFINFPTTDVEFWAVSFRMKKILTSFGAKKYFFLLYVWYVRVTLKRGDDFENKFG